MESLPSLFRLTTEAVAQIVDATPDPRSETPCSEWNHAQVLGHLVGGDRLFARILLGEAGAPVGARIAPDADRAAPTPADYRRISGRLGELFARPETTSGTYAVPVGRLPGPQVILLRSVEHLLHGWDLAKSAGVSTAGLEPAAEELEGPARALLAGVGELTLGGRRPFAPPIVVADDADPMTRMVAAFGRDPEWTPDHVGGYARLLERFHDHDDVELPDGTRRGYGADGMRVNNQVFACTYQGRLMIKLPKTDVDDLIAAGLARPLAKPGQRPMREWALVPFDGSAEERAERAYAFVSGRRD